MLDLTDQINILETAEADQLGGIAGLISVLCAYESFWNTEYGKERIKRLAGIAQALYAAGTLLQRQDCL